MSPDPAHRDLLIRGGLIIDGSGAPGFSADLLIRAGRIERLAAGLSGGAAETLEAAGCVVTPGFVDMHSHADLSVQRFPAAGCALQQGVTTAVVGNCGLTLFPHASSRRDELASYLRPFLPAGEPPSFAWRDLDGFYAEALARGAGINLVPLVGHGSLRLAVKGYDPGAASPEELAAMQELLRVALEQGAAGLSLGLLYPPGSYASREELVTIATQAAAAGALLAVHIRNEGDRVGESVDEAIAIAEAAGARLQLSHQKAVGRRNWGKVGHTLRALEAARARGLAAGCDLWPYRSGSTTITALLPGWALEGGVSAALARMGDPEARAAIRREIESGAMAGEGLLAAVGFEGIRLAECPARRDLEGRSLGELLDPGPGRFDGFFDLLRAIELQATMIIWEELAEEDVRALLRSPFTCIGSDSWPTSPDAGGRPHPRTYGAFPRFLREYVLGEGALLGLEEGIRRITALPATCAGLRDRGRLAEGLAADLVVLDPALLEDRATFEEPHRSCAGLRHVLVNGVPALRDGALTGARAGRLLRR